MVELGVMRGRKRLVIVIVSSGGSSHHASCGVIIGTDTKIRRIIHGLILVLLSNYITCITNTHISVYKKVSPVPK